MAKKKKTETRTLNEDQTQALKILEGQSNVFLTGAAGSGKSFLLRAYLSALKAGSVPILASTGAAAILVGGRTFHSFFGLGILEGGPQATRERALKNQALLKRLQKTDSIIIDEISMISGPILAVAESIARKARGSTRPWGGMRVIAVGDFAQLPPVNPFSRNREWAFRDQVWFESEFEPVTLEKPMRAKDLDFLEVLNEIRVGKITPAVRAFLESRTKPKPSLEVTRLYALRENVERTNHARLEEIKGKAQSFQTSYDGKEKDIESFKKHSPIGDEVRLKIGALVMLRQNDPDGEWVNGSLGTVTAMNSESLSIELASGYDVQVPKTEFKLLNAEGAPVVVAKNFPVSLAWAMTIHKAQGATLDRVSVDLRQVWEAGQAYVALSRASNPAELFIEGWGPNSIQADREVLDFYARLRV